MHGSDNVKRLALSRLSRSNYNSNDLTIKIQGKVRTASSGLRQNFNSNDVTIKIQVKFRTAFSDLRHITGVWLSSLYITLPYVSLLTLLLHYLHYCSLLHFLHFPYFILLSKPRATLGH